MNIFDYRLPSPALRDYVRLYQIIGFSFRADTVIPLKPYWPRPENCLTFYPRGGDTVHDPTGGDAKIPPRSVIVGQHSYLLNRQVSPDFILFQVVLQPGALFRLTGIPVNELTNQFVDAEAMFSTTGRPREICQVNELLSSTDNHLEMIGIVEDFLYYQVQRRRMVQSRYCSLPIDKVSLFLLQNPTRFSLDWLADQACLSTKQFYNQFVQRMGVSPKLYARIARFDKTVKRKNAQHHRDWLSIALESGYYDYQHLVRDYKEFTHLTPNEFAHKESQAPERTFGNAET